MRHDSLRLKYALQWASFEKTEKPIVSRAISYEMQQKKDKEIAYQEAQGYKYLGGITAAQYYLPQDEYKTFLKEMESCSDPQYDYMEVVQLFTKVITQNSIGELLQTNWHQGYPFNPLKNSAFLLKNSSLAMRKRSKILTFIF